MKTRLKDAAAMSDIEDILAAADAAQLRADRIEAAAEAIFAGLLPLTSDKWTEALTERDAELQNLIDSGQPLDAPLRKLVEGYWMDFARQCAEREEDRNPQGGSGGSGVFEVCWTSTWLIPCARR